MRAPVSSYSTRQPAVVSKKAHTDPCVIKHEQACLRRRHFCASPHDSSGLHISVVVYAPVPQVSHARAAGKGSVHHELRVSGELQCARFSIMP
eukprot:9180-Pelagomonas_calceolata.AAC.5